MDRTFFDLVAVRDFMNLFTDPTVIFGFIINLIVT